MLQKNCNSERYCNDAGNSPTDICKTNEEIRTK